jgi:NAD(P)-dependent dehydrogenase (short-subunit alcohol dehydrogenase family)
MDKKVIVITGASDGIGAAAAKSLKNSGHTVIIVGRNEQKTKRVAESLDAPYHVADYARLSDVVRLADELGAYERIDVLCNNAGGVRKEREITQDGFEATFQINVLAPYLLTRLLMDKLRSSRARVIQTTSIAANMFTSYDTDDLNSEKGYKAFIAYGNAKLENVLLTKALSSRYPEICPLAFEPGVVRSNFGAEGGAFVRFCYHSPLKYLFTISTEKSARRLVRLAEGEENVDFVRGGVYSDGKPFKVKFADDDGKIADKLWTDCEKFVEKFLK